ncbi:MAG: GNAT family protein [Microbacterium sp.]
MLPVVLHTPRLELSIPTTADVEAITAAAQDPEVPRWTTLPSPYERAHAEEFVGKAAQWWDAETELTWGIRHDDRWVGMIGLHRVTRGGAAEIGYWMAAPARGRGFLAEAAGAVIDFAFAPDGLDLVRIEWRAVAGNVASARAARALGFRYEGTLRQGLDNVRGRYDGWIGGLLRDDERARQPWAVLESC